MTPPKLPPPPPPKPTAPTKQFELTEEADSSIWNIGIYGPEGIGKSSLAATCKNARFADIEKSMKAMKVPKVKGVTDWMTLRAWIQSLSKCIAGIDSITQAEDWCAQYVIENKKSNEGVKASDSLEDFKYKAGLTFVCDEFKKLLCDIDAANGRDVCFIMVAHMRINRIKNPDGSDFIRYEPRLIDDPKGSNMLRWVQFLDHVAFVSPDVSVDKGKIKGSGSRTIYLDTAPQRICKARGIDNSPITYPEGDDELWQRLGANPIKTQ
jgi:hypothetical protein